MLEEKLERKKQQQKLLLSLVVLGLGILLLMADKRLLAPKYEQLKAELAQTASIARDIANVEAQKESYERMLDESGKVYGNLTENKDAYVSYLGQISMANKLNINKMTVDDVTNINGQLYSMVVQIELQGDLYNVKNLVQQLYDSEMVSRINSFSYRLQSDQNFLWMWRVIDDETLVPWWKLDEEDIQTTTSSGEEEEPHVLCADDLLNHGTALCYLEVEFLGMGG